MRKGLKIFLVLSVVLAAWLACKKPYSPKLVANNSNYLVVEGVINTGNDSTIFKLSRAVAVSAHLDSAAESGARIIVEDKNSAGYQLLDLGNGRYGMGPVGFDTTRQYRVH